MSKDAEVPENRKLWRVSIHVETMGSGKKWFRSDLMSKASADSEATGYRRGGVMAEVDYDRDAFRQYLNDIEARKKERLVSR